MKNEIMTFKNELFGEVRTMCDEKGEPWLVGKDVAEVLGYADPQKAMKSHVEAEDKLTRQIAVSGQRRQLIASNGIEIGRTKMFRWLRKHGYLFLRERRPKQEWVDKGLFEVEENVIDTGRKVWLDVTTKVTGKGQEYFVNGFVSGRFYIEQE